MIEDKDFVLTIEDFKNSGWEEVSQIAVPSVTEFYSSAFSQLAKDKIDERKKLVFHLLSAITFSPLYLDSTAPIPNIEFLSDQDLDFLSEILVEINDAELKSRIADIIWLKRRRSEYADAAISAYLASAKFHETVDEGRWTVERVVRALQISRLARKDKQGIVDYMIDTLDRLDGTDNTYFSAELMGNLQSLKLGDFAKYAAHCRLIAERAEIIYDYDKARRYWDTQQTWNHLAGDEIARRQSSLDYAETFEKQSEYMLVTHDLPHTMAAHFLELAIVAYRRAGKTQDKVDDLKYKLRELQKEANNEMLPIPGPLTDIRAEVQKTIKQISGKPFNEAILTIANICGSDKVAYLQTLARRHQASPINQLLPLKFYASDGRIEAITPVDENEAIEGIKFFFARDLRSYNVSAFIHPARDTILLEHHVRIQDFYPFLVDNLLVKTGREYIIAKGLYAGLTGDFITSTHLLIPQIEESLRHLMIRFKIATSSFDDSGIQKELNLNQFLKDEKFAASLIEVFGEDFIFDLRGLLVERFGENLRNDMAHGLIDQNALASSPTVYLWWLALRFYLLLPLAVVRYEKPAKIV